MALVQEIKQGSSKWIKTINERYSDFFWQEGYGAFSVSPKNVDKVIDYIQNQHEHHQKLSFKDEYKKFLKNYGVDYDERYMWD